MILWERKELDVISKTWRKNPIQGDFFYSRRSPLDLSRLTGRFRYLMF